MINCEKCEKLCCKDFMFPVEVQLDDLRRIAKAKKVPLHKAFELYCRLIPVSVKPPSLHKVTIGLKCPCSFLGEGCKIYGNRPDACKLFPYKQARDSKETFKVRYPCVLDVEDKDVAEIEKAVEKNKVETDEKVFLGKLFLIELKHYKKESIALHASMKNVKVNNEIEMAQVFYTRKLALLDKLMNSGMAKYINHFDKKIVNLDMVKFVVNNLKSLER